MSPKELGRQTALTLMKEMKFLQHPKNVATNNELIDGPDKVELRFQEINQQDALHTQYENDYVTFGLRYCMADGEVAKKGLFDIDHAYTHSLIKKKQKALLEYLNSPNNTDFAEGFLSAQDNSEHIHKYFNKDQDGQIKGTRYFYRICYDDIDNLLLLCHACNMSKSNKEFLEWFGKQEPLLGEAFVKAVEAAGGLCDGIIVKKVMDVAANARSVEIGGVPCVLHEGEGKGLGQFLKDWFDEKYPGHQKSIIENYRDIWLAYKAVVEQELSKAQSSGEKKIYRIRSKLALMLTEVLKTVNLHYNNTDKVTTPGSQSSSHSDDSAEKTYRIKDVHEEVKFMLTKMHLIKKVSNYALKHYTGLLEKGIDKCFIQNQLDTYGLSRLQQDQQLLALDEMKTALDDKKKVLGTSNEEQQSCLSKATLELIIKQSIETHEYSHMEQRAGTAEQRAETEKHARQQAEQRAETEKQARQQAEEELERLKAQIAASQTRQTAESSLSQEKQGLFVSEAQNAYAELPVADEEESEVVKHGSKSSTTQMMSLLSAPIPIQSEKKRHIPMDEQTEETSKASIKKKKLAEAEDANADQIYSSSTKKVSSPDNESIQTQSSAHNPPSPGR